MFWNPCELMGTLIVVSIDYMTIISQASRREEGSTTIES